MNVNMSVTEGSPKHMEWADYAKGVAWGTVALFAVVVFGYIGLITSVYNETMPLVGGMLIGTFLLYLAFTVVHEAGHGNIAHEVLWMKPVERTMAWIAVFPFLLVPFQMFAKIHDYHHAFTNNPDNDPDHWVSGNTWQEASVRALTLPLNYMVLTATRFKHDAVIAETHKSSLVYYSLTFSLCIGLVISGYGLELLMVGIIPAFLASFVLGMLFDWIPHKPTRQQSRYQNTRSYLFPGLKYITMGQNYHHIHHLYPRVSWYHYEKVFNAVRSELEANNAPIEQLFSKTLPGFGESRYALEPRSIDGHHKLTLTVEHINDETPDAVVITFGSMNGKTIPFEAGQYVTISKRINNETITRCYSICESPRAGKLTIGVKRVKNGRLSTYLNEQLKEGDELTVAGPFGSFMFDPEVSHSNTRLTLIAGGSGITPLLSITKTALQSCPDMQIHMIYANRSKNDAMFLQTLNQLAIESSGRLNISYIYEQNDTDYNGFSGYLTEETLMSLLSSSGELHDGLFYLCGPAAMKQVVLKTLQSLNVEDHCIFVENFSQAAPKPEGPVHLVNIALANGISHELNVAENQTVLQAALSDGVKIPHACGVGQCGCCMMQIKQGSCELASDETPGLLPGEQARGMTLACQCMPTSALSLQQGMSNG